MRKQKRPEVSDIHFENLEAFKSAGPVTVLAFLHPDSETMAATFAATAHFLRNHKGIFGIVTDSILAINEGVSIPAIALYRGSDKAIFSGAFEEETIAAFVAIESQPLIGEISIETYADYKMVSSRTRLMADAF